MSKMDGLRAMREARYAAAAARTATPGKAAPKKAVAKAAPTTAAKPTTEPTTGPTADAETDESLCGHRNMSGRTCTRERGHSAKSHRYS